MHGPRFLQRKFLRVKSPVRGSIPQAFSLGEVLPQLAPFLGLSAASLPSLPCRGWSLERVPQSCSSKDPILPATATWTAGSSRSLLWCEKQTHL